MKYFRKHVLSNHNASGIVLGAEDTVLKTGSVRELTVYWKNRHITVIIKVICAVRR